MTAHYIGTTTIMRAKSGDKMDSLEGAWGTIDIPEGAAVIDVRPIKEKDLSGKKRIIPHTVTWIRKVLP